MASKVVQTRFAVEYICLKKRSQSIEYGRDVDHLKYVRMPVIAVSNENVEGSQTKKGRYLTSSDFDALAFVTNLLALLPGAVWTITVLSKVDT